VACATTAAELHAEVVERAPGSDVIVMAAAVADYRPADPAPRKLKKDQGPPAITLEPTVDILAALGAGRVPGQVLVGFAAETDDVVANARRKLEAKAVDIVVANDVSQPGAGFSGATNAVTIVRADGEDIELPVLPKRQVAQAIIDVVVGHLGQS
jgi:phosphopantothenoylcysteine decarboxylase/phosphopantothenate--cysteine ligase